MLLALLLALLALACIVIGWSLAKLDGARSAADALAAALGHEVGAEVSARFAR